MATSRETARSSSARVVLLVVLGAVLLQAAWILTLPPFRGTDEFDHVYRAAQVATGDWRPGRVGATDGRGALVKVPRDLVTAAKPVCESYEYTGPDNCTPVRDLGQGYVEVASAAAAYNPAYYWVVGTAGRPFHGDTALYAMRIATGLLCAGFLAWAVLTTMRWSRSRWPLVTVIAGVTPVMMFSLSVVAPNGLEMCAALCLWMAMLGLCTRVGRERHARYLLLTATVCAIVVTTLRTFGPLWVALIVLTTFALMGPAAAARIARRHPAASALATLAVGSAAWLAFQWFRFARPNTLPDFPASYIDPVDPLPATLEQVPLWILQGIAAFPRRANPAPAVVYVVVGLLLCGVTVLGWIASRRRVRLLLLACLAISLGVPFFVTFQTIVHSSPLWQGRYGLPFHIGVVLLAGFALDRTREGPPRPYAGLAALVVTGGMGLAHGVSIVHVLETERRTSPLSGSSDWVTAPSWTLALLVVAALFAWLAALRVLRADTVEESVASPLSRSSSQHP